MKYTEFKLESYLAKREFTAPFNLCSSDLETYSMKEILQMADEECLQLWDNLQLGYTETKGHPLLRQEISKEYGAKIGDDNVLCFAGAEEGIYSMAQALLKPSDHAIVITPCYQSLESLPTAICSVTKIELQYEHDWELDIDKITEAIKPNTKLLIINFPHNPTGSLISHHKQHSLIELARKHDLWIFSDEVYRLSELDESDRLEPIASLYERGLSLSVMSKAYGLAGLRIGWIACQKKEVLHKIGEVKHYLSICNSGPSEILSIIALRNQQTIISRNRALMQKNIHLLDQFFKQYSEWFEWIRPQGGCTGYPLFKGQLPISKVADKLLQEYGVLILPGNIYDDDKNHFRISFGRETMPEGLNRLKQFIEKNKSEWKEES
jgi:aspartate/methionine/tyrosine aminotransferase